MKIKGILFALASVVIIGCSPRKTTTPERDADNTLVVIHTNDTHSHIDPDPASNLGGALRRQVLIDSIRDANPNVLVIDAGDVVQGTLFFHLYKGEVEQMILNELDYDIQILGNHEFDNGVHALKEMLSDAEPTLLSSNYDFSESELNGMFEPYVVKQYGDHKVGIFALNLNPEGMIAEGNYNGVKFLPWKQTVDEMTDLLRNRLDCDFVIAVTHIGFSAGDDDSTDLFGDVQVAQQTQGINLIIGAHSHTKLDTAVVVNNVVGRPVTIVQTGRYGQAVGETVINLATKEISERLIPVDSRLDSRRDEELMKLLEPYRAGVDSIYAIEVAQLRGTEPMHKNNGYALQNFAADFFRNQGSALADGVQGAMANSGSLRSTWTPGVISEGAVIDMMPFHNKIVVIDILGKDLLDARQIMKARGDHSVSGVVADGNISPDKIYRIATVDYLANGGDYMTPLTRGRLVAESNNMVFDDLLSYFRTHPVIVPDTVQRMK